MIRFRFHRLVLRDGRQFSHLTSEETEAHGEDGFPPHCSGYVAGPVSRTRSEKATLSLDRRAFKDISQCFQVELSKGREVGMSKACVSKSEQKNILGEHHRVDGAGSVTSS